MVPQTWIIECLKTYKVTEKVIKFSTKAMKNCKVELNAGGKHLGELIILRVIFQGNALSILLLVISMMPLNQLHTYKILWGL